MELWPHQVEAVEAVVKTLEDGSRTTAITACGTGKTRVAAEVSRRCAPRGRVLVVVPTLELLAQTIGQWKAHLGHGGMGRTAAIGSVRGAVAGMGRTVDAQQITALYETGVLVSTNPAALYPALSAHGRVTAVTTYDSLPVVAALARDHGLPAWDLMVIDEAHRSAGAAERAWSIVHDDTRIPAVRQLYMTATPRIFTGVGEAPISMDDERVFGQRAFELPCAQAIEAGLLADYRVIVAVVTDTEVADLAARGGHADLAGRAVPTRMLTSQIALAKATREFDLRRIVTFHHRVASAKRFAATLPDAIELLPSDQRPEHPLSAHHLSGESTLSARHRVLGRLAEPAGIEVVSNSRVLTEGVDVPELDSVVFCDPRTSIVDVVQAVGRALRRGARPDKVATILIPILLAEGESPQAALEGSQWGAVWQVVRALRAHDARIGQWLDRERVSRAHRPGGHGELPSWFGVIGTPVSHDFAQAVRVRMVQATTSDWWVGYAAAQRFHEVYDHLRLHYGYADPLGFDLEQWINVQRHQHRVGRLSADKRRLLDELGMIWDPLAERRATFIAELEDYRARYGNIYVPHDYISPVTGYPLGRQFRHERGRYFHSRVDPEWRARLEELGVPEVDNTRIGTWYRMVADFHRKHGHVTIPSKWVDPETGDRAGKALVELRGYYHAGKLPPVLAHGAEAMGVCWAPREQSWRDFLAACDRHLAVGGNLADVGQSYVDSDDYPLGKRIAGYLRQAAPDATRGRLSTERRRELAKRGLIPSQSPSQSW